MATNYLQEQFDKFSATISKLNLYKDQTRRVFEVQDKAIRDFHEQLPDWSMQIQDGSPYFLHFQSPTTGSDLLVKPVYHKLPEQLEFNALHHLKTYHWLLAEAYEAFELFLTRAYSHCGREGLSLWSRPEKWKLDGSLQLEDYNTERKPYGQLKAFRQRSAHFAAFESSGPTGKNYRVSFVLMEKLRQVIVHNGGYCENFQKMIDKMQAELKDLDIRIVREYAAMHFTHHAGSKLIDLFEVPLTDENDNETGVYKDILLGFFRMVVEYGKLILETIEMHADGASAGSQLKI